ncbi:Gfo/Idh/MocA family protein [Stakelama flava]|uniref:Gfo/Idh/MocA family protein n=1 Tax=Stakelama flava TaxID=2860338 RepID=UPI001FE7E518|nr:Gfo/Idh/MocA family oxidoreductase [Stakelama flava]
MERNGAKIRLGLIGIGKIARDQHVPAITASPDFDLVATASRDGSIAGIPAYRDVAEMLAGGHDIDAISIATPPSGRHLIAAQAIAARLPVMVEKPPAATLTQLDDLAAQALVAGVGLFTAWHSREANAVSAAREWLSSRTIQAVRIIWREDIRRWHPNQEWILDAGGFGVFDPAINALSILTHICPAPVRVERAELDVPENRQCPIAAQLAMVAGSAPVHAEFDFLKTGEQTWTIMVETEQDVLELREGGRILAIDGVERECGADREYARLYQRFAELVRSGASDVDDRPLRIVSDALSTGRRRRVAPFYFDPAMVRA